MKNTEQEELLQKANSIASLVQLGADAMQALGRLIPAGVAAGITKSIRAHHRRASRYERIQQRVQARHDRRKHGGRLRKLSR